MTDQPESVKSNTIDELAYRLCVSYGLNPFEEIVLNGSEKLRRDRSGIACDGARFGSLWEYFRAEAEAALVTQKALKEMEGKI